MSDAAPEAPEPEAAPSPSPPPRWRRFTPLLLVAGAVAVVSILSPKIPKEREIELKLADPASVTSVELRWSSEADPVHGGTWRFDPGKAPPALHTKVTLPDGRYELDVLVSRADGPSQPWHRSVELEKADHVTLRVP